MIIRIKKLEPLKNFKLHVIFDDGKDVIYDVKEDINAIPNYSDLEDIPGLFETVHLDTSRTCVEWNEFLDLPSDIIYEYGIEKNS